MNALQKIVKRAKELYRTGKGIPWKSAIKKASAEYKAGDLGSIKKRVMPKKAKRRRPTKKARSKTVKRIRRLHSAEGRAIRKLGSMAGTKRKLRHQLEDKIARELLAAKLSKTKRARKKINKRITANMRVLRNIK